MAGRQAVVVTASDGVASGNREDETGAAVAAQLTEAGMRVVDRVVVADDREAIAERLRALTDRGVALVVTNGGTGFGPRDVTPEATLDVVDRPAPGLAEAMRAHGRASTPMADLSRATAGVSGRTLIVNLPGSPRGATESFAAVLELLPHALDLLAGDTARHPPGHGADGAQDRSDPVGEHDHRHDDAGGGPLTSSPGPGGHDHGAGTHDDPACALAHGHVAPADDGRVLVAAYASPVAAFLLHWGRELGYRTMLVEPDPGRVEAAHRDHADAVLDDPADTPAGADVVVTDHDRDDLGPVMAGLLAGEPRWIGIMGSRRHAPPHVPALAAEGVDTATIGRVHRPIGLDIGSKTPAEIALSTLAGLVADRNSRPGSNAC